MDKGDTTSLADEQLEFSYSLEVSNYVSAAMANGSAENNPGLQLSSGYVDGGCECARPP